MQAVSKIPLREKIDSEEKIIADNNVRALRNLSKLFSKLKNLLFNDMQIITVNTHMIDSSDISSYKFKSSQRPLEVEVSPLTTSYRSQVFF